MVQFPSVRLSLFPTCAVIVTSVDNRGEIGACTIAWNGILSSRPTVIGVSFLTDSFTRKCIFETRDFVVNVPDGKLWKETDHLGSMTGTWKSKLEQMPPGLASLSLQNSAVARSPYIEQCYLNFECRMLKSTQLGLYDCIFGEVLSMRCVDPAFSNSHPKGAIIHTLYQPLQCLGDEYWSGGTFLGTSKENKNHPHGSEH